jgi:hypothetical protein
MRKNVLALSIAAMIGGLAGTANAALIQTTTGLFTGPAGSAGEVTTITTTPGNALTVAGNGIGHQLVVPYYSTQGSKVSLLNLVNTDQVNGKAVKLRYRGASNSDDVFDITIYMSPGDMWTASVLADATTGLAKLVTDDTTCTLPSVAEIKELNGLFKINRVPSAAQTREGYVEIINSADIPPTIFGVAAPNNANALFTATKHAANGKPSCDAAVMAAQENDLTFGDNADANYFISRGYTFPTGGLFANWTIVDQAAASVTTGQATALTAGAGLQGNLVWFPQTTAAVAGGQATIDTLTSDPLLSTTNNNFLNNAQTVTGRVVQALNYDLPDLSTPYTAAASVVNSVAQVNQLNAQLLAANVVNEFVTSTDFATDWIFSMPTRRYHMAYNYGANTLIRNTALVGGNSNYFNTNNLSLDVAKQQICVGLGGMRAFDREENTRTQFVISPDTAVRFCGEVSAVTFNGKASVVGAVLAQNNVNVGTTTSTRIADGWLRLGLTAPKADNVTNNAVGAPTVNGLTFGLPVIGYSAVGYTKGAALGGTWAHRNN